MNATLATISIQLIALNAMRYVQNVLPLVLQLLTAPAKLDITKAQPIANNAMQYAVTARLLEQKNLPAPVLLTLM